MKICDCVGLRKSQRQIFALWPTELAWSSWGGGLFTSATNGTQTSALKYLKMRHYFLHPYFCDSSLIYFPPLKATQPTLCLLMSTDEFAVDLGSYLLLRIATVLYLWTVTDVFQLKLHWAKVQLCLWVWDNTVILCNVLWLQMCVNSTSGML